MTLQRKPRQDTSTLTEPMSAVRKGDPVYTPTQVTILERQISQMTRRRFTIHHMLLTLALADLEQETDLPTTTPTCPKCGTTNRWRCPKCAQEDR